MANITQSIYGTTSQGQLVSVYKLENTKGAYVTISDFGATILSLVVPDKNGTMRDVVLGYHSLAEYEISGGAYFGSIVGRYGNRICNGTFSLNNKQFTLACNDGKNHLHGGTVGFSHRLWNASIEYGALKLTLLSLDGDEGYPGNLNVTVTYTFNDDNVLSIHYEAFSDADTIINLTNHSYFNLNGHHHGSIEDHKIKLFADAYIPTDDTLIPTGEIRPVANTPFDFSEFKTIGQDIHCDDTQLRYANGYDHTFVLHHPNHLSVFAEVYSKESGIFMRGKTTLPSVQFYTGNFLSNERAGKDGISYVPRQGFALETQTFPDSIHHANFPSPILRAGMKYDTVTTYEFSILQK